MVTAVPNLAEPEREKFNPFNPLSMLSGILGPQLAANLCAILAGVGCCVMIVLVFPLVFSNIFARFVEHVVGLA